MIHLLHGSLVDRHFAGTLEPKALPVMFERTWRCARCRRRYERHLLFERVRPDQGATRDERLWQAIASAAAVTSPGVQPPDGARAPRRRWRAAVLTASFAAAVLLLLPRLPKTPTHADPVPRGSAETASSPSLHLYRTRDGHSAPVEGEIRTNDGILVAYSNPSPTFGFLMVFGVDQAGAIHWYYPAYERLGEDPAAVPIHTRAFGVELGEEIHHELPRGDLRMFALFLPRPLRVLEVESLVGRALAGQGGSVRDLAHLELLEGEQTSVLLQVQP